MFFIRKMQRPSGTRGGTIIIILAVIMLLNSFCSRSLFPARTFPNIDSAADSRRLNSFMDGGVEFKINTSGTSAAEVIETARKFIGVPHCMGGKTARCMDCSGLLVKVFGNHGIHLPHNSEEQARYGTILAAIDELREGDLVFFIKSYRTNRFITHSGIYIGENRFIHVSSQNGVTITSIHDPWWNEKFIFGTRIFD